MVSAPATSWICRQSRPASASAARAATTPYSVKSRPHLPHGCIPAPRMYNGSGVLIRRSSLMPLLLITSLCFVAGTPPGVDDALDAGVVGEQGHGRQLHLHPDLEV